jgi:hypothetical protein
MASLYCTFMSDTVGVIVRASSGTTDKWTKNILICNQTQTLIAAGANPCDAAKQAACDVSTSLTTFSTPCNSTGADPSQFWCGIKKSVGSAFCLTNNLGKSILLIGIGAVLLILAFNYATRSK